MKTIQTVFVFMLSALLVVSFGVHTIDTEHVHHGASHAHESDNSSEMAFDINEYIHGIEQKFFLILLLALIFASAPILLPLVSSITTLLRLDNAFFANVPDIKTNECNYLTTLFSNGILNPKLH